jgi:RNA polymerase sigma factor (sigma-70 family)
MLATPEEQTLLAQLQDPAQRGTAFGQLVRTHQRMLYYHVRRMVLDHDDADDVLQNTLLKAWKNLDRFRGDAALRTWLYRIATNEALTHLQQKKRRSYSDVENLQDDPRYSQGPGEGPDGEAIQRKLMAAIATLPERQRAVFNLRYFDEMAYGEMSRVLEVSEGSLKASYHHAVKKIEKYLQAAP